MNRHWLLLGTCAVATGLAGCPGTSDTPDAFVISDTGGTDGGRDGGPGLRDVGLDAPANPDGGADAGNDAGTDAFVPIDAFVPTDAFDPVCSTTCDDGNPCNGTETCDATTMACVAGTALDCSDGMTCTADSCDPVSGCRHVEADTDGDGVLDCADCAPTDRTRYPLAAEACNSIDDDCDGNIDEDTVTSFWADCDGDGWASTSANRIDACSLPPDDPGCSTSTQGWVARFPDPFVDYDCNDEDTTAHSRVVAFHTTPMAVSPDTGFDYDYNCDAVETLELPSAGSCVAGGAGCTATMGWMGAVPACGVSGTFITGCGATCTPVTTTRTQGCR